MNIRATLLAGVMAVPFLAGTALAADTGRLSLTGRVIKDIGEPSAFVFDAEK